MVSSVDSTESAALRGREGYNLGVFDANTSTRLPGMTGLEPAPPRLRPDPGRRPFSVKPITVFASGGAESPA
ncbi:hypothetical protein ACG33_09815 [Steroidobacter denitrificans]|uniref:Uncharacterized protein n=1 Tax=Steroidobacter denitrificans TaxID=465721 RepID=A0A127FCT0_STEDE|nr:hypothetical protein ACG33_09815 [Steroidobacter denitrificans]